MLLLITLGFLLQMFEKLSDVYRIICFPDITGDKDFPFTGIVLRTAGLPGRVGAKQGCFLHIPGDALGEGDESAGLLARLADEAAAAE